MYFVDLIHKATAFSRATFGPGERTNGIIDHMIKEFEEIKNETTPLGRSKEWVDQVILSIDGLTRALQAEYPNEPLGYIAWKADTMIHAKYNKNELREWPDWRTANPDKAIEHVRGKHD